MGCLKNINCNALLILTVTLLLLIVSCKTDRIEQASASYQTPNVLFIAIDDLNDWIGCLHGHPQVQTPNIDKLAKRGMLFTNAHAQSPICNPSRTSLLTGLRPSTTGVYGLSPWIRDVETLKNLTTIPQHFSKHGYTNYSTGKIYHGGNGRRDTDNEFDFMGPGTDIVPIPEQKIVGYTPGGNHELMDWGTFPHEDVEKGDYKVADWAIETLNSQPSAPFFLSVGFFLPHVPLYTTDKWFDLYPYESLQLPPMLENDRADTPKFSWYNHWDVPEPRLKWLEDSKQLKPLVRSYLAAISFVDEQVGRVINALDKNGFDKNTIIVLWSDHGYHLGEKQISGKNTLWDRSTHVPLIFAGPGIKNNVNYDAPVELLDIYPTLNELCHLTSPDGLEGHSLVPILFDPSVTRPWPAITTNNQNNHGIRTTNWRYIQYANGSEELYDMKLDPNEWTNVANDEKYESVISELSEWLPTNNQPPHIGNNLRVLQYKDNIAIWEGDTIMINDPIPGLD